MLQDHYIYENFIINNADKELNKDSRNKLISSLHCSCFIGDKEYKISDAVEKTVISFVRCIEKNIRHVSYPVFSFEKLDDK